MKTAELPLVVVLGTLGLALASHTPAAADLDELLNQVRAVGVEGAGNESAMRAWHQLSLAPASDLPQILSGMADANPLAENWLRSAVETIAARALRSGQGLPQKELEAFLLDTEQPSRARRLAYELLLGIEPEIRQRVLPGMLTDRSLELRRDAVAMLMDKATTLAGEGLNEQAADAYRQALSAARDIDQINALAEKLGELNQQVDLVEHFGFITEWYLIGPFDNRGGKGFDVAYAPEKEVDLSVPLEGMNGPVSWVRKSTDDKYGKVDLNQLLGKHKGAIAYACITFESNEDREIDLRLGCINANKLWLNGQLVISNEVYHSGSQIDQYVAHDRLQKGPNTILLKIAQNEQTEPWAQRWEFQFRLCDKLGTPFQTVPAQAFRLEGNWRR